MIFIKLQSNNNMYLSNQQYQYNNNKQRWLGFADLWKYKVILCVPLCHPSRSNLVRRHYPHPRAKHIIFTIFAYSPLCLCQWSVCGALHCPPMHHILHDFTFSLSLSCNKRFPSATLDISSVKAYSITSVQ